MKRNLTYITLLGLASTVFCIGFLILIVDGYYEYNYYHFIEIGRKDLIARLGFLSWATGFIYYPLVIIILLFTSLLLKRTKTNIIPKQWVYIISPAFLVGLLFYTHSIDFMFLQNIGFWRIGLVLLVFPLLIYPIFLRVRKRTNRKAN